MDDFDLDWDLDINVSNVMGKTRSSNLKKNVGLVEIYDQSSRKRKKDSKNNEEETIISKLENLRSISHSRDPYSNMSDLIKILSERRYGFPNPGEIFTFIYRSKTPKLSYDQHPISNIISLEPGKFVGYNYHLNMVRQYTGDSGRILSNFYKILPEELDLVLSINTKLIKTTQ